MPLARGLARLDLGIKSSTRLVNENRGSCPALLRESSAKCIVRIFFLQLGRPISCICCFPRLFKKISGAEKKTNLEDAFQRPRHRVQPRHRPGVGQAAGAGGGGGLQVKSSQKKPTKLYDIVSSAAGQQICSSPAAVPKGPRSSPPSQGVIDSLTVKSKLPVPYCGGAPHFLK